MNTLATRLCKLEGRTAPKISAPRKVFRIVVEKSDDEVACHRKMLQAGWNPNGTDLCIVRVIVPALRRGLGGLSP